VVNVSTKSALVSGCWTLRAASFNDSWSNLAGRADDVISLMRYLQGVDPDVRAARNADSYWVCKRAGRLLKIPLDYG
jgi:hypothetical protein